jgi:hypothetical protein
VVVRTLILKPAGGQQFSTDLLCSLATKLDAAVTSLLGAAGAAAEIKLSMLPRESQIRQLLSAVKQIMPNASRGRSVRPLVASGAGMVPGFKESSSDSMSSTYRNLFDSRLLSLCSKTSTRTAQLGKDMGTWATYAPTNTEPQRRLHRTG